MSSGLLHGGPEIAARLRELGGYLRLRGESPFRARAYETAAAAIDALGSRFPLLRDEGRLTEVPGIGDKLAATIEELATTGTTATLERHRAEFPVGLLALAELPGVTLPRLRVLHTDLGIVDRATLLTAAESGELARVKGWGPRTITKLLAALSKGPESRPGMLLLEARPLAHDLAALLRAAPGVSAAEVVGDVRRWQEIVSAIHIVGASRDPRAALGAFLASAPVGEVSAPEVQGAAVTARFRLFNGGMAAVTVVPPEQYARTLVRCTGTLSHLDALAARAQARGTTMEAIDGSDEAAIFARLDLPLLPPELREHPDDIEQAAAGDDFADLVALPDIRGFVHCHTTASDGRHDLTEMATAARERGMDYVTITDHSPTASYAGGLTSERLAEQAGEIAAVRQAVGIDILRGTESDIRADGTLDYGDDVLGALEIVIASIHNRHGQDEEAMTRRLCAAMCHPVFKIWGHGLGRLLLRRDPIACRVTEVLDAAAVSRAAIEINGDPHRMDLEARWLREARARRLRFTVSVDAHSTRDYDNLMFGVHLARRAGIRKSEVLNTLSAPEFRSAVSPLG